MPRPAQRNGLLPACGGLLPFVPPSICHTRLLLFACFPLAWSAANSFDSCERPAHQPAVVARSLLHITTLCSILDGRTGGRMHALPLLHASSLNVNCSTGSNRVLMVGAAGEAPSDSGSLPRGRQRHAAALYGTREGASGGEPTLGSLILHHNSLFWLPICLVIAPSALKAIQTRAERPLLSWPLQKLSADFEDLFEQP
jgi:hypothetical protein